MFSILLMSPPAVSKARKKVPVAPSARAAADGPEPTTISQALLANTPPTIAPTGPPIIPPIPSPIVVIPALKSPVCITSVRPPTSTCPIPVFGSRISLPKDLISDPPAFSPTSSVATTIGFVNSSPIFLPSTGAFFFIVSVAPSYLSMTSAIPLST